MSTTASLDVHFSAYGQASRVPAPVSRMMADFSRGFRDGVDINLGVGYVNEKTIPTPRIQEAMNAVAADPVRYRQAFNYGSPAGSANLMDALRGFLEGRGLAWHDDWRLMIGPCGATSVLESIAEVLAPGIVITSDPMYYIYCEALERKGFRVLAVPEDQEGTSLAALEAKLAALGEEAREISFFYFVTVNNPSATMLSNHRRRELYEVAARLSEQQGRAIPIFFDLAYELLLHDPAAEPFRSVLGEDPLGISYEIGTLSKVLAPALRMGYLLGPDGPFFEAMVQKTADCGFSAPLFVQEMAAYLIENHIGAQLAAVNAGYREKAVAMGDAIRRNLGEYIEECRGGSAGFYYYVTLRGIETHSQSRFFSFLSRTTGNTAIDRAGGAVAPRVLYIPGEYCVHPRGDLREAGQRQMRLSYGFEDVPAIVKALETMREAARYAV
jgi:2-aminoadipate transaminase